MIKYHGFLLSTIRYGDQDAVFHFFTKEEGFKSFFSKNVFSPKNKTKSLLQPLQEFTIFVSQNRTKNLTIITKLEISQQTHELLSIHAKCVILFISDFLNQILKIETDNAQIYKEIQVFLRTLPSNIQAHLSFVFQMIKINGWLPMLSSNTFLDPASGIFTEHKSHPNFDENISALWKKMLVADNVYTIQFSKSERQLFLESTMSYWKFHYANFLTPKSLEILRDVYQ